MDDDGPLPAGAFGAWLVTMQEAIRGEADSDVPCNGCTACCRSSQFIHIEPDETDALAHIPSELLFPAPMLPIGNVVMGYDERGHCPMLVDDRCSIYEHRPRTCRMYDCHAYAAADVEVDDEKMVAIAQRVRRWRFDHPTELDQVQHDAVRAAAAFARDRRNALPSDDVPVNRTQQASLAIRMHAAFLGTDESGRAAVVEPEPEEVRLVLHPPGC